MPVKHNLLTSNSPEVLSYCTNLEDPSGDRLFLCCSQVLATEPQCLNIIPATNTLKQKQKVPKDADS